MRHGDLTTLFAIAFVSVGFFLITHQPSQHFASGVHAEAASGALAYLYDDGEGDIGSLPYYDDGPYYYEELDESAPSDDVLYMQDPEIYWPAEDYFPLDYPAYADDPALYDVYDVYDVYDTYDVYQPAPQPQPWYVSALPGIGQTLSYILPPIVRPQPTIVPPPPPAPSCSIAANPSAIKIGGSTVVSWTAHNAARSILSGVGDVPGTGTRTYQNLTGSQAFALTVSGIGGTSTCYASVAVDTTARQPTCIISVNPSTIRRGESANLAWGSQYAAYGQLSGIGTVPQSGGRVVAPAQTTAYSLDVFSTSGLRGNCSATLTVI
jgi:hypothetical protein